MLGWLSWSAIVCAIAGALSLDPLGLFATNGQSFMLLVTAIAGTVLFGMFDAWESEDSAELETEER